MMYINQMIMLCTLNLGRAVCQLYLSKNLNKTRREKRCILNLNTNLYLARGFNSGPHNSGQEIEADLKAFQGWDSIWRERMHPLEVPSPRAHVVPLETKNYNC